MNPPSSLPKVSVRLTTYNQERYIAQAIEGVLAQQTGFDYELVIGEDCSTDNTRAIVLDYARKYPERIRVLESPRNLGMRANGMRTLQACRGEYIALLEGDDYWTCPHKLEEQVAWMDRNPSGSFCAHSVQCYEENSGRFLPFPGEEEIPSELGVDDFIRRNPIPTASVLLRRRHIPSFPSWFLELKMGDWPLYLLLARQGRCRFFPERWAVYRLHDQGVWTGASETDRLQASIEMLERMSEYLDSKYRRAFLHSISQWQYQLALIREKEADLSGARRQTLCAFESAIRGGIWPPRRYLGTLMRVTVPKAWQLCCTYRQWHKKGGSSPRHGS